MRPLSVQVALPDDRLTATQPVMAVPLLLNVTAPLGVPHPDAEQETVAVSTVEAP